MLQAIGRRRGRESFFGRQRRGRINRVNAAGKRLPTPFSSPLVCAIAFAAAILALQTAAAADPPKVKLETVAAGLDNPCGMTFRPGTNELLVSESGAGRIVRLPADKPGKPTPVVTGFPVGPAPAPFSFNVGPLGITFLDRLTFAVGTGGDKKGRDVVAIFSLSAGEQPLAFETARRKLGPIRPEIDGKTAEGFFYGVANVPTALFATSHGDDASGWISRAFLIDSAGKAADFKPLINTKSLSGVGGPMALVLSKRGELVVGESGSFDKPHSAAISFYSPKDKGRLLLSVPTGLSNITGLAYSPRSGYLYALDLSWSDAKEAGLYRIDATREDGRMSAKAVKITALDRPTAMTFASDGPLYITQLGPVADGVKEKQGQVVRITGDL
jgi:hypothetical protein